MSDVSGAGGRIERITQHDRVVAPAPVVIIDTGAGDRFDARNEILRGARQRRTFTYPFTVPRQPSNRSYTGFARDCASRLAGR